MGDSFRVEEPEAGADLEKEKVHPDRDVHDSSKRNPRLPTGSEYGPHNHTRSKGCKKPPLLRYS